MGWLSAVARAVLPSATREWVDVGPLDEYPAESVRCVRVRGVDVAVFHADGRLAAIADVCPHMGAALSEGVLHGDGHVQCPAHDMRFDLRTGRCPESPMYTGRVYPTRVRRGRVFIRS
ncbi:Rieske (2Fe-2S) protein [Candidatus Poribacteria bacterium]|nr:Rieske (2Fe-2S) protein [Candidatus Poribacteria bacterium]MBT5535662.1 Rieske (2Fe-2S) protein [Candidatus Poribacteria bacterium]MBT5713983.1 Rieske (2Fe-2S) protein [Candidatus Poribacteria bacterium]MBT7100682.1 Rieske (2Fe-2S) protein [Candidatus Poribacteria bacterium]MBT7806670.1 Rieske (2Fe-2S) protein [Candidatus Poribacteria bacterium]